MTLKFKIISVDHNGFCGRDNHPADSDIGLVVTPVRLSTFVCNDDGDMDEDPDRDALKDAARNTAIDGMARMSGDVIMQCWTCVTDDARFLDLMDFEVVLYSAGDTNDMTYRAPALGGK
jgi:hypothetical protein